MSNIKLGVNIDHIATLRQARGEAEPDPVLAAGIAELAGADGITIHLREDRRHIQDRDLILLRQTIKTLLNLEMALNNEIIKIALKIKPEQVTLVPEKRLEITTEGGLDVIKNYKKLKTIIPKFHKKNIKVSLFIDPDIKQIEASKDVGAKIIELHTGSYANSKNKDKELKKLFISAEKAVNLGITVNAGHGINYNNIIPLLKLPGLNEFNIGHSIISRAVFSGLFESVEKMKKMIAENK